MLATDMLQRLRKRTKRTGVVPILSVVWNGRSWGNTLRNSQAIRMLQSTQLVRLARRQRRGQQQGAMSVVDYAVTPWSQEKLARGWEWCDGVPVPKIASSVAWKRFKPLAVEQLIP